MCAWKSSEEKWMSPESAGNATAWLYAAIMCGLGLIYYIWMLVTGHSLVMPGTLQAPGDEVAQASPAGGK
jgi:hypothetical protein